MNEYIHPIQQIYYAWDLTHKKSTSDEGRFTGVLSEAKVDLNPHQVEAALFAFKSPLSKGAILADEVGLGKTIEAGIILSELWAERKRRIVIVVPASLRNQWSLELMEKFYLPSTILETSSYKELKTRKENPFDGEHGIIICSYNFAISHSAEFEAVYWDLVVFDEAHKMRNVYKRENVVGHVMMNTFKQYKKVLLTATPLQNNLKELYGLISIIDPHFFSSMESFEEQYNAVSTRDASRYGELKERLSHIVNRTLRSQVKEYVKYTKRTAFVQEYEASQQEMELYEQVSEYLQREGTYGIPDKVKPMLTLIVRKIMSSSAYALSYTLESFIQRLENYKKTGEMSSIMAAVKQDYDVWQDDESEVAEGSTHARVAESIDDEIAELRRYQREAKAIKDETKAQKLLVALEKTFEKNAKLGAPKKALIFTESRRTQTYLKNYLEEHGYSGKVVCFNGTNNDDACKSIYHQWLSIHAGTDRISGSSVIDRKQALVDYFRTDAEIMIATESGAEGINLQFCSLLVNYDMPWNPQRIEQRIGRCHRYGQKFDVVVVNFVNKLNLADCRVYELLNEKFNLFDGVFGCSDEVLGSMESVIDFEKRLNTIYQTCRTEREIAAAFDQLQAEMDEVIQQRIKDTKKTLLENFDEEVVGKLKVRQGEDQIRVGSYNLHFWRLAKSILAPLITQVNDKEFSFVLTESPSLNIPIGKYVLNKENGDSHQLRVGHPLGEYVLQQAAAISATDSDISFSLDQLTYRQMMLEQYKGCSGEAIAYKVKAYNKYDAQEELICCAMTDDGELLPTEFVTKLLETDATHANVWEDGQHVEDSLSGDFEEQLNKLKSKVTDQTEDFVSYEIDKYQAWAEDQVYALENEVIALRHEDEALKRQIRKERKASVKLQLQEEESKKAKMLRQKQRELYNRQDENEEKVDEMTRKLRHAMDNHYETEVLFRFRWTIK
jgi:ERCC4-related helicase